jgi:hypothetical protein
MGNDAMLLARPDRVGGQENAAERALDRLSDGVDDTLVLAQ